MERLRLAEAKAKAKAAAAEYKTVNAEIAARFGSSWSYVPNGFRPSEHNYFPKAFVALCGLIEQSEKARRNLERYNRIACGC